MRITVLRFCVVILYLNYLVPTHHIDENVIKEMFLLENDIMIKREWN